MASRPLRTGNRPVSMSDAPVHGVIGARIEALFATPVGGSLWLRFTSYRNPARVCPESAPSRPESDPSLTRVWTRVAVGAVMSVRPAERRSELPNAATVLIGHWLLAVIAQARLLRATLYSRVSDGLWPNACTLEGSSCWPALS